jgi:hypothetical protein
MDNLMDDTDNLFIMNCMESQTNEESQLMKELELLNACTYSEKDNDVLLSAISQANAVNLSIADPKSQGEIDKMDYKDAKRFNDATIAEVQGMKNKDVFENTIMDDLPREYCKLDVKNQSRCLREDEM